MNTRSLGTLPGKWTTLPGSDKTMPLLEEIDSFVNTRRKQAVVFPAAEAVFKALQLTMPADVRVVIIGQDPYHGPGQAMGLAFGVDKSSPIPPSLRNILKEVVEDIGVTNLTNGDLTPWSNQGVLLLNTVLTVEEGHPGSHANIGWEIFTDLIITALSDKFDNIVFILWGKPAQSKSHLIDPSKHLILTAPHPSPLSAYRGFFGCKHFSKANRYLTEHGKPAIIW